VPPISLDVPEEAITRRIVEPVVPGVDAEIRRLRGFRFDDRPEARFDEVVEGLVTWALVWSRPGSGELDAGELAVAQVRP
jgi:hypothetical protein